MATGKERSHWLLSEMKQDALPDPWLPRLLSHDGTGLHRLRDGSALVWDLTPALHKAAAKAKEASAQELDGWWVDLSVKNAGKAQRAVWSLVDASKQAMPFLESRLKATLPLRTRNWFAAGSPNDSSDFGKRQAAFKELVRLGELVEPMVKNRSMTKRRWKRGVDSDLLQALPSHPLSADELRQLARRASAGADCVTGSGALLQALARAATEDGRRARQESLDRLSKRGERMSSSGLPGCRPRINVPHKNYLAALCCAIAFATPALHRSPQIHPLRR